MSLYLKILSLILIFSLSRIALAAEILEQGISAKALGMGNAYLVHGKGHDAIFYNPAGFAGMQGVHLRLLGIGAGLNGLQSSYDKYSDIVDQSDTDLAGALNQLYGEPVWGRTDVQTSISLGNFIFGGFGRANVGFTLQNPAFPRLASTYFLDYGMFAGWGAEIVPKHVDFGFLVKRITRLGGGVNIGPASLAYLDSDLIEDDVAREGTGYGADLGLKLKFPVAWNPTIAASWQNVGRTSFSIDADETPPPSLENDISLGVGIEEDLKAFVFRWELDYRHLDMSEEQEGKKYHTGIELDFPALTLRGGFSQGYYTYGASIDLWFFEIDAASYGVELGEYPGQEEDRRYIFQLVVDLGFDSAGNIINLSKRRGSGIKQRR